MHVRRTTLSFIVITILAFPGNAQRPHHRHGPPPRRLISPNGVGSWTSTNDVANLIHQNVSWTYNWGPLPHYTRTLPPSIEFVPMVAAPNNNNPLTFASIRALKSKYTHILSFTEPDINDFSVASAIDLYPSLIETGLKIGSPAPFNTTLVPGDWLYEFMSNITAKELPLDFIALHYFSNDFNVTAAVAKFKKYVESVFRMYRLPIWVTEYAMISFDHGVLPKQVKVPRVETQAQFATAATEMLNGLVFVERYAWFALPQNGDELWAFVNSNLYNGTSITPVGKAYRAVSG